MVSLDHNDLQQNAGRSSPDLQLFFRNVQQGKKKAIKVRSWSTILDVKKIIEQKIHLPIQSQQIYFGPLLTSGKPLPNHRTLHDAGIYRSGETLLLDVKRGASTLSSSLSSYTPRDKSDIDISTSVINSTPRQLQALVGQARQALALNLKPAFILDGSGGTYFMHNARKAKIAVFKPADEEPYAENNPRGYIRQPGQDMFLREGVVPGEACIREVAAFMLDHGGISGVPMTTLVECRHPSFNVNGSHLTLAEGGASIGPHSFCLTASQASKASSTLTKKVGSFQEFVRSECSMDDLSPSKISVEEVHKIAILDIRLMNADRNSANLLCRRRKSDGSIELVPIDHGFCLRSVADTSWMDWCWLDWPHLKEPMSRKTKEYILKLDIEKDAKMLRDQFSICDEALAYFYASSSILKAGAKAGLSLYEIAVMCCRNDNLGEIPSKLEVLFGMAGDLAESAIRNDRWGLAIASRAIQDQLSPHGGSLLTPMPKNSFSRKAASAFDLTGLARATEKNSAHAVPGMTQSAGSEDSSSYSDDAENEDAVEWAAELINAVSMDKGSKLVSKPRSHSVASDSSSEDDGFWHTSPNSHEDSSSASVDEDEESHGEDEESIGWSSAASPCKDALGNSFMGGSHFDVSLDTLHASHAIGDSEKRIANFQENSATRAIQLQATPRMPNRVSFANIDNINFDFDVSDRSHPCLEDEDDSKFNEKPLGIRGNKPLAKLGRSRSYSALSSSSNSENQANEEKKTGTRPSFTEEQYREYFLKFVDLVVVREITAAVAVHRSTYE